MTTPPSLRARCAACHQNVDITGRATLKIHSRESGTGFHGFYLKTVRCARSSKPVRREEIVAWMRWVRETTTRSLQSAERDHQRDQETLTRVTAQMARRTATLAADRATLAWLDAQPDPPEDPSMVMKFRKRAAHPPASSARVAPLLDAAALERLEALADFPRAFLDADLVHPTTGFSIELLTGSDRVYPDFAGYKSAPDAPRHWKVWCWSRGLRVVCVPVPRAPEHATEEGLAQAVAGLATLLRCEGLEGALRHWIVTGEGPT